MSTKKQVEDEEKAKSEVKIQREESNRKVQEAAYLQKRTFYVLQLAILVIACAIICLLAFSHRTSRGGGHNRGHKSIISFPRPWISAGFIAALALAAPSSLLSVWTLRMRPKSAASSYCGFVAIFSMFAAVILICISTFLPRSANH